MNNSTHRLPRIPGYCIVEQLYEGSRTQVYRAIREADQKPVVIKLHKGDYPSFNELVQFRNQYTIAKSLDLPGIVRPLSLELYGNSYALVMEDYGGVSLWRYIEQHPLGIGDFLAIALPLCDILDGLYRHRVVHKDIKPANILIHPQTKQIKLIDFSIASLLPRETQEIQNPNGLEGTLPYLAPEQTGRMNRGIDYRADFYALGVTFYQLLTGQLPFRSDDPLELVHFHIAKIPPDAYQVNPNVPKVLSAIVGKLMAKNAEDRYQSALGLKHDLTQCLRQWKETGTIANFTLGQRDFSDRFSIPEKLYGRESSVQTLLEAFVRVSGSFEFSVVSSELADPTQNSVRAGFVVNSFAAITQLSAKPAPTTQNSQSELMLVAGYSGVGKTAVVNEVHKPIARQRGYFIKGKYDQFGRNIPFSAFVQAFRDLMRQLLSESDVQLKQWQSKILAAVGENGQVLIEVIPELERVIGQQTPVPELTGGAAQNRFNLVFQKFVQLFAAASHPLVVFLDDLQWADSASLKLLQLLMTDAGHLLVIGAYRDNEVSAHPLLLTLSELEKTGAVVNTMTLAPLQQDDLNQLVADTLSCSLELARPLSELTYQKTKGNPFFATQFLKSLHEEKLITFDCEARYWRCDLAKIRALATTEDVVEFMALQLQKLPSSTLEVLKLAACIGNSFDLATLAIGSEKSQIETATDLWKALQEGLVLPVSEVYKFYQGEGQQEEQLSAEQNQLAKYRFLHDRVQQASYSLIAEEQKIAIHLKIGQLLLNNTSGIKQDEKLFDIVNHLNMGLTLMTQPAEHEQIARLNLLAAKKARAATAYEAAVTYATTGIKLLKADCWQSQYELALMLHELAAENAFLSRDFGQMERWAQTALNRAKTPLDRVKIYEIKIQSYISQHKLLEAIALAKQVLSQFGVQLPDRPTQEEIQQGFQHTADQFASRAIEELLNLPLMTAAEPQAAIRIASNVAPAVYIAVPPLYPLLILSQVNASIQHGNAPLSAFFYASYGLLLNGVLEDMEAADRAATLALGVLEKLNAKEVECRTRLILGSLVLHGTAHLRKSLQFLRESYQIGLETGDVNFAGYAIMNRCQYSYFSSQELGTLELDIQAYSHVLVNLKQAMMVDYCQLFRQVVLNLLGRAKNPCVLVGDVYDEAQFLPQLLAANDLMGLQFFYLHKLILGYLFGGTDRLLSEIAAHGRQYLAAGAGFITVPIFYFYDSLAALAGDFRAVSESGDRLQQVAQNQARLQIWAHHAPMNHLHKYTLVEAEKHRVLGDKATAIEHYDRAIQLAKENEYLQEEALANELAAKFYLEWGKEKIAQDYLIEAYYCYARWGARAKVDDLEQRYPQLLAPVLQRSLSPLSPNETISANRTLTPTSSHKSSTSSSVSAALDLATILKASQTLSREIELEKLLATLLQVAIENAGANKCALLLVENDALVIKALAQSEQSSTVLCTTPLADSQDVPASLIYSVKRRLEPAVIWNALFDPTLSGDSYIVRQQPKSLLCTPILNQGKLLGILYLENHVTNGAFTEDRVELLNLLCAQAAIPLENARLYQQSQTYAHQLEQSLTDLQQMQLQLVQNEKMSALGNLVAGVAHEINNPVGFLAGNLQPAQEYVNDFFGLIDLYQTALPNPTPEIQEEVEAIDLEYVRQDLPKLLNSMQSGIDRIRNISTSLRTFSRADRDYKVPFDLHEGIDSTLLILKHRLKANDDRPAIEVTKNYGKLPLVECFPGQLNQVFMNILANAIDALEEVNQGKSFQQIQDNPNSLSIHTDREASWVIVQIKDNGIGMNEAVKQKIFDHLFTTKSVGKGTGLGLAIAHQIVVEKHGGTLKVDSDPGKGAVFTIRMPIK